MSILISQLLGSPWGACSEAALSLLIEGLDNPPKISESELFRCCDGLTILGPGSGTIRRYGFVGIGVSLRA